MSAIDANILLIALPAILRGINLDPTNGGNFPYLLWILFGYGVVTATLLVTFGRLSDIFGRVRLYNLGFAIFAVGSTLLFFVPNTGSLGALEIIFFRILQGIGGAFLMANGAAIITDAFPANDRCPALGINMVVFLAGSLIGLVFGGLLATADLYIPLFFTTLFIPGWRVVFLVSVPFGIFGAIWSYWKLKEVGIINRKQKLDFWGNVTFAGGLTLLLISMTYGLAPYGNQSMGWGSPWVIAGIVISIGLLILFPIIESRVDDPMFRLDLFKIKLFSMANFAGLLVSIARGGVMIMLVILLQGIWLPLLGVPIADTPFWAGIAMLPMALGFVVMGPISGYLSDKYGSRFFATLGTLVSGISFLALLSIPANPSTNVAVNGIIFFVLIFIMGLGGGLFASPNTSSIMSSVPPEFRGVASGMRATLQNTGSTLSIAFFFTLVIFSLSQTLPTNLANALTPYIGSQAALQASSQISPTAALFSAFLGIDPLVTLSKILPVHFFAETLAKSFMTALDLSFVIGALLSVIAAVVSVFRGSAYIHGIHDAKSISSAKEAVIPKVEPRMEGTMDP